MLHTIVGWASSPPKKLNLNLEQLINLDKRAENDLIKNFKNPQVKYQMNARFFWQSPEKKPRWRVLIFVRFYGHFGTRLGVSAAGFQATYPANSMTLVAIPKA